MFQIYFSIDGGEFRKCDVDYDAIYTNGKEAAARCQFLSRSYGSFYKFQPRPMPSADEWRSREAQRVKDNPLPQSWSEITPVPDHFLHLSTNQPGMLAYTTDERDGARDRQTAIRPGRYLQANYPFLDTDTRNRLIQDVANTDPCELLLARTPDEIQEVYEQGPSSCMARDNWYSDIHPARVYGAGDLAVAYIVRDEEITARCLCWPEKKIYGASMYGDYNRLEFALELAGFTKGDLKGARLLKIDHGKGYIMPYVDSYDVYHNKKDSKHFIFGYVEGASSIEVPSTYQTGLTYDPDEDLVQCDRCEDLVDEENTAAVTVTASDRYGNFDQTWCSHCAETRAVRCDATGELFDEDLTVTLEDGTVWNTDYFADHGATCEATGADLPVEDTVMLEDDTVWSKAYFEENGWTDPDTGEHYAKLAQAA